MLRTKPIFLSVMLLHLRLQDENGKFNRAKLFNVGYLESLALYDYECFIFHDVDLVPEDDRILYTCPEKPRHLSVAISTLEYR